MKLYLALQMRHVYKFSVVGFEVWQIKLIISCREKRAAEQRKTS